MGYIQSTTSTTDDAKEGISQLLADSVISSMAVAADVAEHHPLSFNSVQTAASTSAKHHSRSFNSFQFAASASAKHHSLSFNSFQAAASANHRSLSFNSFQAAASPKHHSLSNSFQAAASAKHHSLSFNSFEAAASAKHHSLSFNSFEAAASAKHRSLSFNSFQTAASAFLDVNSNALHTISKLKDEILMITNPDLLDFITDHLNSNNNTIRFFTTIKHCLQKAREAELLVRQAVVLLEDCHDPKAALDKLWQFKEAANPFTEKFIEEFKLVVERQNSILQDLRHRKDELDRKLDNGEAWRQVWKILYYAALAAISISALVLAVLGAPATLLIPFTAAFSAMPRLQKLVKKGWDKFQSPHEEEMVLIDSLGKGTEFAIQELNSIKALVEELDITKIKSKVHFAEFAIKEREVAALKMGMVAIQFMAENFSKRVDDLEKEVDLRVKELKKTTVTILETFLDSLKSKKRSRCLCMKFIKKKKR